MAPVIWRTGFVDLTVSYSFLTLLHLRSQIREAYTDFICSNGGGFSPVSTLMTSLKYTLYSNEELKRLCLLSVIFQRLRLTYLLMFLFSFTLRNRRCLTRTPSFTSCFCLSWRPCSSSASCHSSATICGSWERIGPQ